MAKNELIKKAFSESEYTPELIEELKRCRVDPVYFIKNYVYLQHATKGTMLFDLYPFQEELVQACLTESRLIGLISRQSGKTQTISMFLLWFAMFHEDKTIVIASKNDTHAQEILDRIRFAYEELPNWLKAGCKYYNKHRIEFDNGSRIISQATTSKTGRGYAISKLYLDELAFISPKIQTEMWRSIAPTLSTGGDMIITSTPNGDTDLFATLWREANSGGNNFKPKYFPWHLVPGRGEKYLSDMKGELGPIGFAQEVLCLSASTSINACIGQITMGELYANLESGEIEIHQFIN
jgi:hypothetical protein